MQLEQVLLDNDHVEHQALVVLQVVAEVSKHREVVLKFLIPSILEVEEGEEAVVSQLQILALEGAEEVAFH